jgi:type IV pilus assembly protein PilB
VSRETDAMSTSTLRRGKSKPYAASGGKSAATPSAAPQRLGDLLAERGLISHEQLREALLSQGAKGQRLGATLVALGLLTERELAEALAEQSGLLLVDLATEEIDRGIATLLPESEAKRLVAVPFRREGERIDVAVADPFAEGLLETLIGMLSAPVRLRVASGMDILETISDANVRVGDMDDVVRVFEERAQERKRLGEAANVVATVDENAPVVRVINLILEQAVRERASDVHIEPGDGSVRIRVRTDGALHEAMTLPEAMASPVLSRIKVMANLNIVERRRPQDGNFTTEILGRDLDVRVATSPTVFGEMAVLRLLDKSRSMYELSRLGMPSATEAAYRELIRNPYGLVICAGPTGSGKTTTLYATLEAVRNDAIKVATIEDPVEYVIPRISQIQIHEAAGLTFASGLRALLRQDPDTILVGEIRDVETARIAVQAALTGHFVMSSLHATDASAALHRFLDMGIEPFLLASSLTGVVGQRLVRRNCPRCTAPYEPSVEEAAFVEKTLGEIPADAKFMKGAGCSFCRDTGFFERVGVYEVLTVTDNIRRLMVQHAGQVEVRAMAVSEGMRPLARQAVELAMAGTTTVSEIFRTVAVV